jgi:uncharacterized membrane protein YesL
VPERSSLSSDTYLPFVLRTIWEEFPRFLWGALLFSLCCAPAFLLFSIGFLMPTILISVLTVAPAWAALQADHLSLLQEANRPYTYFGQALRHYGRRSIQLALVAALPLMAILLILPRLQQANVSPWLWLWIGVSLFCAAITAAISLYTFPLLICFDQGVPTTLRNGWILAVRYPFNTGGLLGMGILFGFAVVYLSLGLLSIFIAGNCLLVLATDKTPDHSSFR